MRGGARGSGGNITRAVSGGRGTTGRLSGEAVRVRDGGGTAGRDGRVIEFGTHEGNRYNVGRFIIGIWALLSFELRWEISSGMIFGRISEIWCLHFLGLNGCDSVPGQI